MKWRLDLTIQDTIEASYTSQFENHLRAILNLPFSTDSKVAGIMVNLVGAGFTGNVVYENMEKYCWTSYTTYLR
jgi:5-(carboxyamino)imidazole ribonucleotide synthase